MIEKNASALDFISNDPVEGRLLADQLEEGALAPEEALRLAIAISSLLHKAHRRGEVHGSISPYSIVLGASGPIILRPASPPDARGDGYRSPEQVRGQEAGERSDIFSFGALLYHMVAGRAPFLGQGAELEESILHRPAAALMATNPVAKALEAVIAGCLEKDPTRRRQRIQNVVIELKLAGRPLPRVADARPQPPAKAAPDPPWAAALARWVNPFSARPAGGRPPRFLAFLNNPGADRAKLAPIWVARGEPPAPQETRRRTMVIGAVALAATGVCAALYFYHRPRPVVELTVAPPENATYPGMAAVSPDAHFVTFSAVGPEGQRVLWLRALDESHAHVISGTEGAFAPFWSPDSQSLGFFANESLKTWKVHVSSGDPTGAPRTVCPAEANTGGGAWNKEGVILFAPSLFDGLYQVPAAGGKPQPVLKLDLSKGQRAFRWPQFLPDGKRFLFFVLSDASDNTGVYTGALDSTSSVGLFRSETNAVFSSMAGSPFSRNSGYLLFMKDRDLMGQGFNTKSQELEGGPITVAADIGAVESLMLTPVSVSSTAVLVYQTMGRPARQLVWMDRAGKQTGVVGEPGDWGPPKLSPDGKRIAVGRLSAGGKFPDLWVIDQAGGSRQVTSDFGAGSPVWSPDGSRLAFWGNQNQGFDICTKPAAPGGAIDVLYKSHSQKYLADWSHDGRYILFGQTPQGTASELWGISMADNHAGAILDTVHSEGYAALSADGKWMAFQSDESGANQVYVRAFDGIAGGTRRTWQISRNSGALPRWRADGRELFFVDSTGDLWAAAVHPQAAEFVFDEPKILFQVPAIPKTPWNFFDVAPDGQRFLLNIPLEWPNSSLITVVTNWAERLQQR